MSAHTPVCSGILLRTCEVLRLGVFHMTFSLLGGLLELRKAAVSLFIFFSVYPSVHVSV